jgi:membrane fusion protein (multidrug efflux system)
MKIIRKRKMRFWIWGAGILLVLFLIINKVIQAPKKSGPGRMGPGGGGGPALSVDAFIVKPLPLIDRIETTGTLLAEESVDLRSETSGRVDRILFREGSRVRKGELLVKIDDDDLQANLLKLKSYEKLAEEKEYRQKQMLQTGAASQQEYDAVLNELNAARADRKFVEAQIEDTEIWAPFDGTIGLRQVSEGAFVNSNTPIASLQNLATIKIEFSIPETFSNRVQTGSGIRFKTPGHPSWREARIYAVEPKIDEATRTLRLRARCANPKRDILPGAFADVEVNLRKLTDAMVLPSQALVPGATGSKAFVLRRGRAAYLDVETGLRDSLTVQVTRGLAFGDTVLVSGLMQLRPEALVRIREVINP